LLKPPVTTSRQPTWLSIGVSATLHGLLLVLAVAVTRQTAAEPREQRDAVHREPPRIDMIYVPEPEVTPPRPVEPPKPRPTPPKLPPTPPPPPERKEPEPEPNAPPEAIRTSGAEEASAPEPAAAPRRSEAEATLESEARRIFGRPRTMARAGVGPEAIRPMEAWVAERPERCIPRPSAPRDSAGPAQMGTVVGRIFRQDNGKPLAGAHLQMIGTQYVSFTDGRGQYHFNFDAALIDNCRTQYVKVSAPGYESRLLVLMIGPNRSEDVLLRRR
jgi:hypothetical protein